MAESFRQLQERLKERDAEILRLKEALQEIADFDGGYDCDAWCIQAKIATEALKK